MNISKITVLPQSIGIKKVVLEQPNQDIINSVLESCVSSRPQNLPSKIVKKIMKQDNMPQYVNKDCFVATTNKYAEDARVIGGRTFDFLS